jgi:excinuclease ABC subunit A
MDVIECADPSLEGGDRGGHLVYQGAPEGIIRIKISYLAVYSAPI